MMAVAAYLIGGPYDLTKQVMPEAEEIVTFARILSREAVTGYRKRCRLEDQGENEVWIYEAMSKASAL